MTTDLPGLLPASLTFAFRRAASRPYTITVTLAELDLSVFQDFGGADIVAGTGNKVLQAWPIALGGDTPANASALQTYAEQAATDWYLWRMSKTSQTFAGFAPWEPDGLADRIVWTMQPPLTRVVPWAFDDRSWDQRQERLIADVSLTGTQTGWDLPDVDVVRVSADSTGYSIQGIAGGYDGARRVLWNVGSNAFTITHNSGSAAETHYKVLCEGTADVSVPVDGRAIIEYFSAEASEDGRWRCVGSGTLSVTNISTDTLTVNETLTIAKYLKTSISTVDLTADTTNFAITTGFTNVTMTSGTEWAITNIVPDVTASAGFRVWLRNTETTKAFFIRNTGNVSVPFDYWAIPPQTTVEFVYNGSAWVPLPTFVEGQQAQYTDPTTISSNQAALAFNYLYDNISFDFASATPIIYGFDNEYPGRVVSITNSSAYDIVIHNESSSATATTNRITTPTGANIVWSAGTTIRVSWDTTTSRWVVIDWPMRPKKNSSVVYDADGLALENDQTSPGNSYVYGTDSGGTRGWQPGSSLTGWELVTVLYSDFSDADTSETITLKTLAAYQMLLAVVIRVKTGFTGPSLGTALITVGTVDYDSLITSGSDRKSVV